MTSTPESDMTSGRTLTIAFLAPIAHGHANVHFAILRYLLTTPRTDGVSLSLHIISDEPQRKRVLALPDSKQASVTFHPMGDTDMHAEYTTAGGSNLIRSPPLSLFRRRGISMLMSAFNTVNPTPDVYLSRYNRMVQILEDIKADLFVVDMLIHALGLDVVKRTGIPHVVLSPGPSLDLSSSSQPQGRGFWKYPWMFTTHTYPVALPLIPFNIIYGILFIALFVTHPKRRKLDAARKAAGLPGTVLVPVGEGARLNIHASLAAIEYPHKPRPNTIFAGPILTPVQPLSKVDYPQLAEFIEGGPGRTVIFNLGSLFDYSTEDVRAVSEALVVARERLADRGGFRVIWKLPRADRFQDVLDEVLGVKRDGIRIEEWIDAPALAVLQHPNVAVSVSHGGANSVIEAMYAGRPHLILAAWFDLYTLAARAEWLGCGLQANKGVEPAISGPLLADALVTVLRDREGEEGARIKRRAEEVGNLCRERRGDQVAAEAIVQAALTSRREPLHTSS